MSAEALDSGLVQERETGAFARAGVLRRLARDRVAALRQAFMETMTDPAFLEEARRLDLEITPMPGETLQATIDKVVDTPASVLGRIHDALAASDR